MAQWINVNCNSDHLHCKGHWITGFIMLIGRHEARQAGRQNVIAKY